MSDKGKQDDSELFATDDPDASADSESTTEEQETDFDGEEIEEKLDLDDESDDSKSPSKAQQQRDRQVDTWYNRVLTGEYSIEDIPDSAKWVKPRILERLKAVEKEPEIEKLIEKKWAAKEDESRYKYLKSTLDANKLTASQKKELSSEFKDLRKAGLSKAKALEKAMRITGITGVEDKAAEELRKNMRIPAAGGRVTESSRDNILADPDTFKKVPEEERIKQLEALRNAL